MTATSWSQTVYTYIRKQLASYEGASCVVLAGAASLLAADVLQALRQAGWTPQPLPSEPMALRHLYESLCRVPWPLSSQRVLLLLQEAEGEELGLPYDIEHDNPVIRVKVTTFFPALDASILRLVPSDRYEMLFQHVQDLGIEAPLSADETLALVLKACYGLRLPGRLSLPESIRFLADLVRNNVHLPESLAQEVAHRIRQQVHVVSPLSLGDVRNFLALVWQTYRRMVAPQPGEQRSVAEEGHSPLLVDAASWLSRSPDLQAAFTQLRLANALPRWELDEPPRDRWLVPQVHYVLRTGKQLGDSLEDLSTRIPTEQDSWDAWASFALAWADVRVQFHGDTAPPAAVQVRFQEVQQWVEDRFLAWLKEHYARMVQSPFLPRPYVVHHLLHFLAATYRIPQARSLALLVIDGMALDDWRLARVSTSLAYREHLLAAFIPTVTIISRRALLSGKKPSQFMASLTSTQDERTLWTAFWSERGLRASQIGYWRGIRWRDEARVRGELETSPYRVAAIVVDALDKILHQAEDTVAFQAQWAAVLKRGNPVLRWIEMLSEFFDVVVLTSDHGHVEGVGAGDIPLGKVAETRALRARIFEREMRARAIEHPAAVRWPNIGLPAEHTVVLARGLHLFAREGERAIAHGGASLEEVVVPAVIFTKEEGV